MATIDDEDHEDIDRNKSDESNIMNSLSDLEENYEPSHASEQFEFTSTISLNELHSKQYCNNLPPRLLHSFESFFCKFQKHDHSIRYKKLKLCKESASLISEVSSFLLDYTISTITSTELTSTYSTSERTLSHLERMEDARYSHTKDTIELSIPNMLNRILRGPRKHVIIKRSLGFLLRKSLELNSQKTMQICGISRESFKADSLLKRAIRLAYGLQGIGLLKNQIVVISSRNCTYIDEIILAVIALGAACCFLDPDLDEESLLRHLEEVKISLAICHGDSLTKFSRCVQIIYPNVKIVYFNEREYYPAPIYSKLHIPYGKLLSKYTGSYFLPDEISNFSHEVAFVILLEDSKDRKISSYTHTQISLIKMLMLARENFYHLINDEKVTLSYSVPSTIPQIIYRLISLDQAITNAILPRFNEFLILQSIQEYQVNSLLLRTDELRQLTKYSLFSLYNNNSPLKMIHFYGDYLPCCIYKNIQSQYKIPVVHLYSLSEVAVIFEPRYFGCCRNRTAGILAPNMKAAIINEKGERLGPYQKGELWLNPGRRHLARDLNKSWGRRVTSSAWICTGDKAYYDRFGYFYIRGKLGLNFDCNSKQIDPVLIETSLYFHSNILECVVLPQEYNLLWDSKIRSERICPSKQKRLEKNYSDKLLSLYTCLTSPGDICSCVCADKPYCNEYCSMSDTYSLDTRFCWDEPCCPLLDYDNEACTCSFLFEEEEETMKKMDNQLPSFPDCKKNHCNLYPLRTKCPCENKADLSLKTETMLKIYAIRCRGKPSVSDKDILNYLEVQFPAYKKVLKHIQWVERIPKNINGEIYRNYLNIYNTVLNNVKSIVTL